MISTKKGFIGIFISIILVIGLAIPVFASAGVEENKEEDKSIVLFFNEEGGKDTNDGVSKEKAVKSLKKIKELFEEKTKEIIELNESEDVKEEDIIKTIVVCSNELDEQTTEKLKDEDIAVLTADEYEKKKQEQETESTPDVKNEDKSENSPENDNEPATTEIPTETPTVEPSVTPVVSAGPTIEPSATPAVSADLTVNPTAHPNKKTLKEINNKNTENNNAEISESEISCQAVEENEKVEVQDISDKNTEDSADDTETAQADETVNQPAVMNEISAEAVNEQAIHSEAASTSILRSIPGRDLVGHGTTKTTIQPAAAVTSNKQTTYNNSVTPTATTLVKGGNVQTGNEDNVLIYTICACLSICALVLVALMSVERKRRVNNLKYKEKIENFKNSIK